MLYPKIRKTIERTINLKKCPLYKFDVHLGYLGNLTDWFEVTTVKKILEREKKATKEEVFEAIFWKKE